MKAIPNSELIINPDGSIYHLNLKPEHICDTLIFVGDPDRVDLVSSHFDEIEFTIQKREFKTVIGSYKGLRLNVISTGIGPDNIDIVLNELDALANIDFETRTLKPKHRSLRIIRIGTSGSLQKHIPIDRFLISTFGLGLNTLLHSYQTENFLNQELENAFIKQTEWPLERGRPYAVKGDEELLSLFASQGVFQGITATANGFYGPQGRSIRIPLMRADLNQKIEEFNWSDQNITNLEMETSAIYGLSAILGHRACSLNAILANRVTGEFSSNPEKTVEDLIQFTLNKLVEKH
jgi:uridine phosphorylase